MSVVEQRKESKKTLSFVIPVYNVEKYIGVCLDSLLNQDVPKEEYEILCINDGSTDGSLKILQEYAEKYENIVVIDKPNEGVSATRNLGIEKAQGEYIWFVDSDDWIARNCLGYLFDVIKKHNVKVLELQHEYIEGVRIQQYQKYVAETEKLRCEISCVSKGWFSSCFIIINKALIDCNGLHFPEGWSYAEDLVFLWDLHDCIRLEQGDNQEMAYCKGVTFYFYRQNETSAMALRWTKNLEKYAQSYLAMAREAKERLKRKDMPSWYMKAYQEHLHWAVSKYMLEFFPILDLDVKQHLKQLKQEGLYPLSRKIQGRKQIKKKGLKEKILNLYFSFSFKNAWFYPIYCKRLRRSYKRYQARSEK